MKPFFKKIYNKEKNCLYKKYAVFNIIRTNATRKDIIYVATPDTQLFDIFTTKMRKISIKITFKTNAFTR